MEWLLWASVLMRAGSLPPSKLCPRRLLVRAQLLYLADMPRPMLLDKGLGKAELLITADSSGHAESDHS
eukprot:5700815-Amphidinium_carterae.1